ncbi:hypothetical protein VTK73DRAFT_6564 [Phialemonium thermophilum]|uniref:Subtelomeric hrmA-associated cluster protein AFUB-079030/YDR124W-like helical bundle domain-containing protein n=1 Tax=Phialemonium thermophilum TaxID=223376 RepID=A0ABR3WJF7_9PEZI
MVHEHPRNAFSRPSWPGETFPVEQPVDEGRYREVSGVRRPPISIDKALREQCNIPAKSYFVAVVLDDDTTACFAGPSAVPEKDVPSFFNLSGYLRYLQRQASGTTNANQAYEEGNFGLEPEYHRQPAGPQYSGRRGYERRRLPEGTENFDDEGFSFKARKRPRANVFRRDADDSEGPIPIASSKKGIRIGDSDAVWNFYDQRFRNCQQTACKLIAKAWVKAVEPKKQSNHPYTGSDEKAPDWWPKPWGPTRDERVRHKEPDHLYKKERVHLLNHILRMVVEPNEKQHPDIQKLNLNVARLEEVTMDALSTFFSDKDNTNNARKKPYLKEIFKVARFEERYKNGEIDGDTIVFVVADDKIPYNYQSDNEESNLAKEDETEVASMSTTALPQPRSATPHNLIPASNAEQTQAGQTSLQSSFMNELPVRAAQYGQPMVEPDLGQEQHSHVESGGMTVGTQAALPQHAHLAMSEICVHPHDASRRGSMFSSAAEFPNPQAMYPSGWQSATTAPNTATMYAFTHHAPPPPPPQAQQQQQQQPPQQHTAQTPYVHGHTVPLSQPQPYLSTSFDGLSRPYDPNQTNLYRPGPVHHSAVPPSQGGYTGYVENRVMPGPDMKMEPLNRTRLH